MRNAQINTDGCFFCFLSWHVCLFVDRGLGMCVVTYWSSATSLDQQTNFFFHVLYLCSLKRESSWWGMLQPTCCSQSGWALMSKLRYWITCIGWEPPVTALAKLSKSACCEHHHHLHHHPHVHPIVSSKISACFRVDALITPLVFFIFTSHSGQVHCWRLTGCQGDASAECCCCLDSWLIHMPDHFPGQHWFGSCVTNIKYKLN